MLPNYSRSFVAKTSLLAGVGLLALAVGCSRDQVSHFRVPKEAVADHPDHPGHADEGMPQAAPSSQDPAAPAQGPKPAGAPASQSPGPVASARDLPAPPKPSTQGSLKWTLPKGWSEVPGEGMRFATFKSPVSGRHEATVVVLPGAAGGELANVNRWRGQIGLGPIGEVALAAARQVVKTKAGALNVYDFTSEGQAKSRMVAGLISTPDGNTWFLKLTGDAGPVAKAKPDFMHLLESLRLD